MHSNKASDIDSRNCFYIKIPTDKKFIPVLLTVTENYAEQAFFDKNDIHNIVLSVDEAAANIIKHSYKNKSGFITGEFTFLENTLRIALIHQGSPFDLSKYSEPDIKKYIKERKKGGFGIYLMKNLMDNILYTSKNGIHKIILVKEKR